MPINNYKPFATGGGANVISQGAWEALAALTNGFTSGVAQSAQLNKAWRQSSVMAAVIGQFINDYGALDALDDGNVANLVRDLARSMQGGKFMLGVATGTANDWVLTPVPSVAAYAAGHPMLVVIPATNTSTTVNAAISGLADRRVKKSDGTDPAVGDLVIGREVWIADDGVNIRVISPLPSDLYSENLPTYPEILSGSGLLSVSATTGQVVVDSGGVFLWRGLRKIETAAFSVPDRTFVTAINKTYHLRWNASGTGTATPAATFPNGRFELIDLTGASPAESDASYDTTYDRMLIAIVVTDGANAPNAVPLLNKARLSATGTLSATISGRVSDANGIVNIPLPAFTLNWSRRPSSYFAWAALVNTAGSASGFLETITNYSDGTPWVDGTGTVYSYFNRYGPVGVARMNTKLASAAISGTWTSVQTASA